MQRLLLFLLCLFNALFGNESLLNRIDSNNDHGFWVESDWRIEIAPKIAFTVRSEHRFGAGYRIMWYQEYAAFLHYDLLKLFCLDQSSLLKSFNVGIGLADTEILLKNTRQIFHRVWVLRPMLEYNTTYEWQKWRILQRVRVEDHFHLRPHYKNFAGYRYRLIFYTPWKWTTWNVNPFIYNEWFFRKNTFSPNHPSGLVGGWHQNRFRIGLEFEPFGKVLSANVYWQWRTLKKRPGIHPSWFNTYQYGAIFNFAF